MDLETDALLFAKTLSRKRSEFNATLFSEKSLKQHRDLQIYTLLGHKVWLELESDREVIDYNELPKLIQFSFAERVLTHQFRFAVRKANGVVQVIDINSESHDAVEPQASASVVEIQDKSAAIQRWCTNQGIEYRLVSPDSFAGQEIRLSNLRAMLKFIESAHEARDVACEERVNIIVASLAPIPIRHIIQQLDDCDETIVVAQLARGIFSGYFEAPIDRRRFDGALVINLAKS